MNAVKKRIAQILLGILLTTLGLVFGRLWWATLTPRRPANMPIGSVWVWAPPAPLDFSPRGYWLGCWLDGSQNVNRCRVTDRNGHVHFEDEYRSLIREMPIPSAELLIRTYKDTSELWAWSKTMHNDVAVVRLANGEILVPFKAYNDLR